MNQTSRQRSQWPRTQDPMGQLFDRLFEGRLFGDAAGDESSVVTSQWAPLVDIKEEGDRFVLYADIPGVDPADILIFGIAANIVAAVGSFAGGWIDDRIGPKPVILGSLVLMIGAFSSAGSGRCSSRPSTPRSWPGWTSRSVAAPGNHG